MSSDIRKWPMVCLRLQEKGSDISKFSGAACPQTPPSRATCYIPLWYFWIRHWCYWFWRFWYDVMLPLFLQTDRCELQDRERATAIQTNIVESLQWLMRRNHDAPQILFAHLIAFITEMRSFEEVRREMTHGCIRYMKHCTEKPGVLSTVPALIWEITDLAEIIDGWANGNVRKEEEQKNIFGTFCYTYKFQVVAWSGPTEKGWMLVVENYPNHTLFDDTSKYKGSVSCDIDSVNNGEHKCTGALYVCVDGMVF